MATTLREVKDFLETVDGSFTFSFGFDEPHSWRGQYCEVSFTTAHNVTAPHVLSSIDEAVTDTFEGWKGGYYKYGLADVGHLEAGGAGCYTEDADQEFDAVFQQMKTEWTMYKMKTETKQKPARKTAAQKRAEVQAARAAEFNKLYTEFAAAYESRLLKLVHAYMSEYSVSVSVYEDTFTFSRPDRAVTQTLPVTLPELYDFVDISTEIESAEFTLTKIKEDRRLMEEREIKKSALLARLTDEEKELLGL
jgi:hypothetical protein